MKQIKFKSLSLLNFKGVRSLHIGFSDGITTISGRNAIGKTTIADAIMWVLFDTGSDGKKLEPKTYDSNHNIIPEIEHSAQLVVLVDGEQTILKRTLTDKWSGPKCTNTYKYYIGDDVVTAAEYRKCVDSICHEVTFRLCSSPTYFVSRPWQDQRKFLQQLVPDISAQSVAVGQPKFDFVLDAIAKESLESYLQHIKYKRTEIQRQLDEVPVRLGELDKALPEAEDWEALQRQLDDNLSQQQKVAHDKNAIVSGGASLVRNEGLRRQLEFTRKRIDEMEKGARKMASDEATKHQSDVLTASVAHTKSASIVEELKSKMNGFTETEIHLHDQLEDLDKRNNEGSAQFDKVSSEQWSWDDKDSFCPHCGQPLPFDKLSIIKKESEERFKEDKAQRLKKLITVAGDIKKEKEQCHQLLDQLDKDRSDTITQLTEAQKALKDAEAHLDEVNKDTSPSYTDILAKNENYSQATSEVTRLEKELDQPAQLDAASQKMLVDLHIRYEQLTSEAESLRSRLAKKESFDHVSSLIDECRKNKLTYQQQLDELDQKIDAANELSQLFSSTLEAEVNKHFRFVQWSLFSTTLSGEKKLDCECYHDGVPYSRLNGAAQVNTGIDIALTISRFYGVSVPMILDNCESNLDPIHEDGHQQIRLYVSHDETLKVDNYGGKD